MTQYLPFYNLCIKYYYMGKSVFILPSKDKTFNREQFQQMRRKLGISQLKLEGPFSEYDGGVSKIVNHVRTVMKHPGCGDALRATFYTLMPHPKKALDPQTKNDWKDFISAPSLDIPFVNGLPTWDIERLNSGSIAQSVPFKHNGSLVRGVTPDEILILAVSVLRSLGVESYYGVTCQNTANLPVGLLDGIEVLSSPYKLIPSVIIIPNDDLGNSSALRVLHWNVDFISKPEWIEIPDHEALLSIMKIKNARRYADELLNEVKCGNLQNVMDRTTRAVHIGHTLFEGRSLWTKDQVMGDVAQAKKSFKHHESSKILLSVRESIEYEYAHMIYCSSCHTHAAISAIIDVEKARLNFPSPIHGTDPFTMLESVGINLKSEPYFSEDSSVPVDIQLILIQYILLANMMNYHLHDKSDCQVKPRDP